MNEIEKKVYCCNCKKLYVSTNMFGNDQYACILEKEKDPIGNTITKVGNCLQLNNDFNCNRFEDANSYSVDRLKTSIEVLKKHNEWRCGGDGKQTNPETLRIAIETIINYYESDL